jgi:hypothetical protein
MRALVLVSASALRKVEMHPSSSSAKMSARSSGVRPAEEQRRGSAPAREGREAEGMYEREESGERGTARWLQVQADPLRQL